MKFLIESETENPYLPVDFRSTIMSCIKKSLSEVNGGKYYNLFYGSNRRRPFTFAVNLPQAKFSKENIKLGINEFKISFSTGDTKIGFILYSAFIAQKGKKFMMNQNSFTIKKISKINEKLVKTNSALVKMLSPLCLREHINENNKDIYYSVNSINFKEKFSEIVQNQLIIEGFDKKLISEIKVEPINARKTVVKHYNCYIECSIGEFAIYADSNIINHILKYGIGSRKSSGFGFAELIVEG